MFCRSAGGVLSGARPGRHPALLRVRAHAAARAAVRPGAVLLRCVARLPPLSASQLPARSGHMWRIAESLAHSLLPTARRREVHVPRVLLHSRRRFQCALIFPLPACLPCPANCTPIASESSLAGKKVTPLKRTTLLPAAGTSSTKPPKLQDAQPLFDEVLSFYASKGIPLPARPPLYLVEQNALNAAAGAPPRPRLASHRRHSAHPAAAVCV